jgi:post-GPI attachment to proteins factor 3
VRRTVAAVAAALYLTHIGYLALVTFDYGWNMAVNIAVSAVAGVLWVGWAAVRRPPHAWRALLTVAVLSAAMALELLDFAPLGWVLDAHALWHAATVPTMLLWYRFLIADAVARRNKVA